MNQTIFDWETGSSIRPQKPLMEFIREIIRDGFRIHQIIPVSYAGSSEKKVNRAIIICEKECH